jgi:hypothetical protein
MGTKTEAKSETQSRRIVYKTETVEHLILTYRRTANLIAAKAEAGGGGNNFSIRAMNVNSTN